MPDLRVPRLPIPRGAARREQLFDDLVRLLLREGFARLTLDDIAARLHCSKRTLYGLADSKEQLVRAAVVHFFRGATRRVEATVASCGDPAGRLVAYLGAVSRELAPASARFFDDVAAFPPTAGVYERNTRAAAGRVREILGDGVRQGVFRPVDVAFAADVVAAAMVRIQRREVAAATGLGDAAAYQQLAELLLHGLTQQRLRAASRARAAGSGPAPGPRPAGPPGPAPRPPGPVPGRPGGATPVTGHRLIRSREGSSAGAGRDAPACARAG